jgi:hypothetical protein
MAIDHEDKWGGMSGGHSLLRFDWRSGQLPSRLELLAANVTACVFGGKDL